MPLFVDVSLDFDGVVHRYDTPWSGLTSIPDPPVEGALEWILAALNLGKTVAIHSTRSRWWIGRHAMRGWLRQHAGDDWDGCFMGLCCVRFPKHKPAATFSMDDRGYRFSGKFPNLSEVLQWKPWNKTAATVGIRKAARQAGRSV